MQEARSKFSVEVEPEDAAVVDPLDGSLSPDGTAVLHFKRSSPSATVGRVNCKVCTKSPGYGFCMSSKILTNLLYKYFLEA